MKDFDNCSPHLFRFPLVNDQENEPEHQSRQSEDLNGTKNESETNHHEKVNQIQPIELACQNSITVDNSFKDMCDSIFKIEKLKKHDDVSLRRDVISKAIVRAINKYYNKLFKIKLNLKA